MIFFLIILSFMCMFAMGFCLGELHQMKTTKKVLDLWWDTVEDRGKQIDKLVEKLPE